MNLADQKNQWNFDHSQKTDREIQIEFLWLQHQNNVNIESIESKVSTAWMILKIILVLSAFGPIFYGVFITL